MTTFTEWQGCYDKSLRDLITADSFAHPAKMSRGLSERIFDHGQARGYWRPGDILVDPFAGVFTTGLVGAYRGYQMLGVELEPRFVRMTTGHACHGVSKAQWRRWQGRLSRIEMLCPECRAGIGLEPTAARHIPQKAGHRYIGNLDKNRRALETLGRPLPMIQKGDSRHLESIVADMLRRLRLAGKPAGAITSPPYAETAVAKNDDGIDLARQYESYRASGAGQTYEQFAATQLKHSQGYGGEAGQIGVLKDAGDVAAVVGAITSPPFAGNSGGTGEASSAPMNAQYPGVFERHLGSMRNGAGYGASQGQINAMPEGDVAAVVGAITSPPYNDGDKADSTKERRDERRRGEGFSGQGVGAFRGSETYGNEAGQIGRMKGGDVAAVVGAITSPPWGENAEGTIGAHKFKDPAGFAAGASARSGGANHFATPEAIAAKIEREAGREYGDAPGQIGKLPADSDDLVQVVGAVTSPPYSDTNQDYKGGWARFHTNHDPLWRNDIQREAQYGAEPGQMGAMSAKTYWQAVAVVYGQLRQILPAGGVAAIVVKDYVKKVARVPLCDQTCTLLEALGFEIVERCRAMLVKETATTDLWGEMVVKKTERKSFFRRLAEKKGSPRIDWEEVIFARKRADCPSQVECPNCHTVYSAALPACPTCGR